MEATRIVLNDTRRVKSEELKTWQISVPQGAKSHEFTRLCFIFVSLRGMLVPAQPLILTASLKMCQTHEVMGKSYLSRCLGILQYDNPAHTQSLDIWVEPELRIPTSSSHLAFPRAPFKITA